MSQIKYTQGQTFHIQASDFNSQITCIDLPHQLFLTVRKQTYKTSASFIETYASSWFLGFIDNSEGNIGFKSGGEIIIPKGRVGIFLPPFTLIEWVVRPGVIFWQSLMSSCLVLEKAPHNPVYFSWTGEIPKTLPALTHFFSSAVENAVLINEGQSPSSAARRTKKFIDKHFTGDLKVSMVAQAIGVSREAMSREFKKTYGISPIKYRHILRVFEACNYMNRGFDVTRALFESGFSDPSQFIHHFYKCMGFLPTQYNLNKRK